MLKYIVIIGCSIGWIFLFIPSIVYLFTAWNTRFEMLKAVFDENRLKLYFKQFYPSEKNLEPGEYSERFENKYFKNYGKRRYIIPLILLGIISGLGMLLVAYDLFCWLKIYNQLRPINPIAISAFLGAYMWVAIDQLQRFRNRDFTYHDVYNCSLRFFIAIPLGVSFAALFKDTVGITTAFFLGAFPLQTLLKYGRRFVNDKLKVNTPTDDDPSNELEQLQSINKEEAERYRAEGITNILQLAYSDPIDLTMRTNFDFNYVVDCISQSLLRLYIGKEKIDTLCPLSIRGAQEVVVLFEYLHSNNLEKWIIAEGNFKEISAALKISENSLNMTLLEVQADPYTKFINSIWCP